jgi:hypothetical protein
MDWRRTERRRRRFSTITVVLAIAAGLAAPVAASAYDWQNGDVFVGLSDGHYNVYDNGGTLRQTIDQTATGGLNRAVDCAFDNSGVLHTTAFDAGTVVRFLLPEPHTKLADITVGTNPESISFLRNGNYLVGHQANPNSLRLLSGAGTPMTNFSPAAPASLIDLSADQRTVFYVDRNPAAPPSVHRFDVASGANLPDFASLPAGQRAADLKLLPPGDGSGGLIVAQTADIKRLDGAGNIVQTYDFPGQDTWFGIALDPDGKSFWAQTSTPGAVFRFNIATGAVDRGPLPSAATAFGICVRGTRLAALDNADPNISIATPAEGATFVQGQSVTANYTCADDSFGTGIASCSGTVAPGATIDTASVGRKSFTVDAKDLAGNTSSVTHSYTVVAPTPGTPPKVVPRILVSVSFRFAASDKATTLTSFSVKNIPSGSTLTVSCKPKKKGSKCPAKKFTKKNAKGTVKLKTFIGKKFKKDTVITIQVTKSGMVGAVKLVTIRKRNGPSTATRCLPPGAKKAAKCS